MSHHRYVVKHRRYVAGYGFIDEIKRYGKNGIEYLKPKIINGVRHLIPLVQAQLPKLEELANKGIEAGVDKVKNFVLDKAKDLTKTGANAIEHSLDRVNGENGRGIDGNKQKYDGSKIRKKKLLAIIERSMA